MSATPEALLGQYQAALAAQDWEQVAPLLHPDVSVTFSNGQVHQGRQAVETAFRRNFSLIKSERYQMSNLRWPIRTSDSAVCLFDFDWSGEIDGKLASGKGRGTHLLVCISGDWLIAAEHLGPRT